MDKKVVSFRGVTYRLSILNATRRIIVNPSESLESVTLSSVCGYTYIRTSALNFT